MTFLNHYLIEDRLILNKPKHLPNIVYRFYSYRLYTGQGGFYNFLNDFREKIVLAKINLGYEHVYGF
jgi:hypothetical protein